MKRSKTIGIVFGGISPEHNVSIESARMIFKDYRLNIDSWSISIIPFYIDKTGLWFDSTSSSDLLFDHQTLKNPRRAENPFDFENIDGWLPMMHGKYGEDGTIQKILEQTKLPFAGTDAFNSKNCFDKISSRKIADVHKISQPDFLCFDEGLYASTNIFKIVRDKIQFPCFVKPSGTGSSIGISKVHNQSEFSVAIKKALAIDKNILIERSIEDCMELEIAVIGRAKPELSEIGTIQYEEEFYTQIAKYNNKKTKIIIPAKLPEKIINAVKELSLKLYKIFRIRDFCRIDYFYSQKHSTIYWNEINTIPGFTNMSMFPMLWKAKKIPLNKVIERIVKNSFK